MTTLPKTSGLSDTLRGGGGLALPDGGRALATAAETSFSATAECQREMTGFVAIRLEKDGDAVREMTACKNLAEVAAIQSRWMEETLRDYNSEMSKLMAICTKSVRLGAGPRE